MISFKTLKVKHVLIKFEVFIFNNIHNKKALGSLINRNPIVNVQFIVGIPAL